MNERSESGPFLSVDEEGIAHLVFDDPDRKQNVLAEEVMRALRDRIGEVDEGARSRQIRGLLIRSGKSNGFIAGADVDAIREIEDPGEGEAASLLGQEIFRSVETLPIPTLALIHGVCLGGGTELSLACTHRVASDDPSTEIGLPEVQLGILPAWGGTTRLPRLIGLQAALDIILTGKRVSARKAKRTGLVDQVVPASIRVEAALEVLHRRIDEGEKPGRAGRGVFTKLLDDTAPGRRIVLSQARKRVIDRTGGHYPAPLKVLDVMRKGLGAPLEKAFALEARAAGELIASPVSKNLLHVFRLREEAKKGGPPVEAEGDVPEVERLGVLGAGVMGGGIAQLAAYNGVTVRMKDIRQEAVADGLQHARELFDEAVEKRKMTDREADDAMNRVTGGVEYDGFGRLDLVVEAVVEKMEVKRSVLAETEGRVRRGTVITTNTSSLSVDEMAEALERPADFAGMHFFNPVHKMPLVEVVQGRHTSDRAVATVYRFALDLGKVPVVCSDGPGFLVNRILGPYLNEAGHLLAEGAAIEAIDDAAEAFGMPMGPVRLIDEVGIDVARHAGETLADAFGERLAPSAPLLAIGETERLGRKGGLGFYRYDRPGGKAEGPDPDIYAVLAPAVPDARGDLGEREIRARLVLAMMNEAARVLEDGVVERAAEVDLGMIMGTGFPPFRGGLLRYADSLHPRTILDRLLELESRVGPRFAPAPLVRELAGSDRPFYEAYP